MSTILYNNYFQNFAFSIIFLLIFKIMESKFLIFSKIREVISKKFSVFVFGGICIVVFGVLSALINSYFKLNQTLSNMIFCFSLTLVVSLVASNSSKSK